MSRYGQPDDGRLGEIDRSVGVTRGRRGRFIKVTRCDGCGKPITGQHFTDDRVCQGSDGPGFYLCHRKQCGLRLLKILTERGIEALRGHYTATRARNEAR